MSLKQIIFGMALLVSSSSLMARDIDQVIQALAPYVGAAKRPYYELKATQHEGDVLKATVAWTRGDGGIYEALLTISGDQLQAVEARTLTPAVDVDAAAAVQPLLETLTTGPLVITGLVKSTDGRVLVAYEQVPEGYDAPPRYLAEVVKTQGQLKARSYQPRAKDRHLLQDLALMMARFQALALAARYDAMTAAGRERGEDFPGPLGPLARLEVELRLARITTRHLQKQTAETSAVGFDPNVAWIQYKLPSVLSDNAIFVTFSKNGQYRLEDFN